MELKSDKQVKWINGLDTIRFILAFMVLLSHLDNPIYTYLNANDLTKPYRELAQIPFNGVAAVIAFFLISGFVIHLTSKGKIDNLLNYFLKRYLRILIPLAIIGIIGWPFNHPEKGILWSLICELIFYTLYPFLLKIKHFGWKNIFIFSFIIAYIFIFYTCQNDIQSFVNQKYMEYHGHYWQSGIFTTWIVGLPCWLLGVILAEKYTTGIKQLKYTIWLYRIIILAISILLFAAKIYWYLSFILSMNIFAILVYYWLDAEIRHYAKNPSNVFLEKIGNSSYSLYIAHPILVLGFISFIPINSMTYIFLLISIVGLSYLFYLVIEKPSHQFLKRIKN